MLQPARLEKDFHFSVWARPKVDVMKRMRKVIAAMVPRICLDLAESVFRRGVKFTLLWVFYFITSVRLQFRIAVNQES